MSQRGGSVVTYVRWGEQVRSPIIDKGQADVILSFELLEAARLDGAGEMKIFFRITLPLLWEVLSTLLILSFIGSMQQFPVVFAMTQGGPYGSTELMGTYLYKVAFEGRMFSYGCAMAIVMAVIILFISVFGNRFIKAEPIEY